MGNMCRYIGRGIFGSVTLARGIFRSVTLAVENLDRLHWSWKICIRYKVRWKHRYGHFSGKTFNDFGSQNLEQLGTSVYYFEQLLPLSI